MHAGMGEVAQILPLPLRTDGWMHRGCIQGTSYTSVLVGGSSNQGTRMDLAPTQTRREGAKRSGSGLSVTKPDEVRVAGDDDNGRARHTPRNR